MTKRVEYAWAKEPLPGIEKLTTEADRAIANRPQFKGGIGHHVYVNGHDLAVVEQEAFALGRASKRIAAKKPPTDPDPATDAGGK